MRRLWIENREFEIVKFDPPDNILIAERLALLDDTYKWLLPKCGHDVPATVYHVIDDESVVDRLGTVQILLVSPRMRLDLAIRIEGLILDYEGYASETLITERLSKPVDPLAMVSSNPNPHSGWHQKGFRTAKRGTSPVITPRLSG